MSSQTNLSNEGQIEEKCNQSNETTQNKSQETSAKVENPSCDPLASSSDKKQEETISIKRKSSFSNDTKQLKQPKTAETILTSDSLYSQVDLNNISSDLNFNNSNYLIVNSSSNSLTNPSLISSGSMPHLRWNERISSSFIPSVSYIYEVHYTNLSPKSHGFTWQWQYLPFSSHNLARNLIYCVVKSIDYNYGSSLTVGDIILKVNDTKMILNSNEEKNILIYNNLLKNFFNSNMASRSSANLTALATASNPNNPGANLSIKFLRSSSTSSSSIPSASELLLFSQEEKSVAIKFTMKNSIETNKFFLDVINFEAQFPVSIKKMVGNQKLSWQYIPQLPAGSAQASNIISTQVNGAQSVSGLASTLFPPSLQPLKNTLTPSATSSRINSLFVYSSSNPLMESVFKPKFVKGFEGRIYRDKTKFAVYYHGKIMLSSSSSSDHPTSSYLLGRYDNELDANKVLTKVLEVSLSTGALNPSQIYLGLEPV